jgi:hypothetical protein
MPRIAPVVLVVLVFAGCGGGGDKPDRLSLTTPKSPPPDATATPTGSSSPSHRGPVTAREKRIVKGWTDALRHGDVERAVSFWAVPATVANPQPVRLLTRRAVRFFNSSLPCGAKLLSVKRDADYILATFVLTNRPGKHCDAPGNRARTAFLLRGGKIVQWLRAPDPDPPSSSETS